MRTHNPVLRADTFTRFGDTAAAGPAVMTLQGTVVKSALLLGICAATAAAVWGWMAPSFAALKSGAAASLPPMALPMLIGCVIGGLVLALIIAFSPRSAPFLSPIYAVAEGGVVGAISVFTAVFYKGGPTMVLQAALLTFGILAALLLAYLSRLIKPTENFKLGVFAATGGIALVFLGSIALSLFGIHIPHLWENGWIGIGFASFVVVIASLNLVLDFDFIEQGAEQGAPKHMEWYAAFGLLVTLVWLYLSILRLLRLLGGRE
ncbi:MAG: Bax inhibitor-1/YccA family protein [Phycisphaerales bacterium]